MTLPREPSRLTLSTGIGLGTAPIAIEGRPSEERGTEVIISAVEAGATIIDTADAYCVDSIAEHGYGERLVSRALRSLDDKDRPLVASKVGEWRPGDGSWQLRGRPDQLRMACHASLRNLGAEVIGLLQLHRPDPLVPIEESIGALEELRREGKVERIGVCNVTPSELRRSLAVADLVSVQNAVSVFGPVDHEIISLCEDHGLLLLAHSPFGGPGRSRRLERHAALTAVARRLATSPYLVALAWLRALSGTIVPIPGTTDPVRARYNVAAERLHLAESDVESLGPR